MSLYDYYDRQIPEYYPTMHMDGYTLPQILHAAHRKLYRNYIARKEEQEEAEVPVFNFKSVVKIK